MRTNTRSKHLDRRACARLLAGAVAIGVSAGAGAAERLLVEDGRPAGA